MVDVQAVQQKMVALSEVLKGQFIERDRVIEGMVVALLARQHVLLLGPPGTAKSALASALCSAIGGADYFQWLMTRYSTPEEVFGPVALSQLKKDKFKRVTTGKLPECHVAFLDEVFKANSAILNALLTIINERKFHNNGGAVPVPLESVVGASNELPEGGTGGELAPLYDRFLLRYWIEPIKGDGSFVDLISDEGEDGAALPRDPAAPVGAITLDELHAAQQAVDAVRLPRKAAIRLAELRSKLARDGVSASDRRWKQAVNALRANAWLSGDAEVTDDHFAILSACLWDEPEQRAPVAVAVHEYCGQGVAEAMKVHDAVVELIGSLPRESGDRVQLISRVSREGKRAEQQLEKLLDEAVGDSSKRAIKKLQLQLRDALDPVRIEARRALGI